MTNPSKPKTAVEWASVFDCGYDVGGGCRSLAADTIQAAMDQAHNEATEAAVGAAVRGVMGTAKQGSHCLECGPDIRVDEDGCCSSCGRDAMWYRDGECQCDSFDDGACPQCLHEKAEKLQAKIGAAMAGKGR